MSTPGGLPLAKKRKLSETSSAGGDGHVQSTGHTHIAFTGPGHDDARKAVAEGEQVLNSQNHKYETFEFEGSTYVLTGPNQQVLVVYDAEHPDDFWNEVTDRNFITAHLQHHPLKMEVFVQDMRKTYVLLTRDEARLVLRKVLGSKRIPYTAATKADNRDVRGPWVYAMVPPVLYTDYVAKQRRNARKIIGSPAAPKGESKAGDEVVDEGVVRERVPAGLAPAVVPRRKPAVAGGARRTSNARAQPTTAPMQTSSDTGSKPSPQVSPSKYKPLVLSPVRPQPSRAPKAVAQVTAAAAAPGKANAGSNNNSSSDSSGGGGTAPASLLSESQTQSIDRINNTHKSLMQLCDKMADMLITQRGTDEYLQGAVSEYHAMWSGCTTYVQLKASMAARKRDFEAKNQDKDYPLMDDLVWLHIFTNPDLVRKLRNRVAQTRAVKLDVPLPRADQSPQPMAT